MATPDQVNQLRRMTGYTDTDPYDDPQLSTMIDVMGINSSAARLWSEKASELTKLVNISESGSSRQMGDLYKNALEMVKYYNGRAAAESTEAVTTGHARTRAIVREG